MAQYQDDIKAVAGLKETHGNAWNAINPEYAARMRAQNKFKTDRKSTRLNSSHIQKSRMPSSA